MVMPGDNVSIEVELITPIAMEKTIRFAIREGGKTVGAGRVAIFWINNLPLPLPRNLRLVVEAKGGRGRLSGKEED
jgi:hypothetical protein